MAIVTKSERIHLVATPNQMAAWKLCADAEGVSLSEWLRRAAERRIVAPSGDRWGGEREAGTVAA